MANRIKVVLNPPFGALSNPPGVKEAGQRYDFVTSKFDVVLSSFGYRLIWTRATKCSCTPPNPQLNQPDPNCALCAGSGYYYYGPSTPQDLGKESLTDAQATLIKASKGMMIRGVLRSIDVRDKDYEEWGSFRHAGAIVTVRKDNELAYRDRLVAIDMNLIQSEIVIALEPSTPGGSAPIVTRYPCSGAVLKLRSVAREYKPYVDFKSSNGKLMFLPGHAAPAGERLTIAYETFPTYVVDNMPHARRATNVLAKTNKPMSPEGDVVNLPIEAVLRLENNCDF